MEAVRDHTLEMVQMVEYCGFTTAWAAGHHALEMTIAPNPFQILNLVGSPHGDDPSRNRGCRSAILEPRRRGCLHGYDQ